MRSSVSSHLVLRKCVAESEKKCVIIASMGSVAYIKPHNAVQPEQKPKDLTEDTIVETLKSIHVTTEHVSRSRMTFRRITQSSGEKLNDSWARHREGCFECKWTGDELRRNLIERVVSGFEGRRVIYSVPLKSAEENKFAATSPLRQTF